MPLLFYIVLEVLTMTITEEKEIKIMQIGKEVILSLLADDMILLIHKNLKKATRKLLELINKSGKFQDTKLICRNVLHSYTLNQNIRGDLQDGRGVRHGDHLSPQKCIKNITACGLAPTECLLNADRGH